MDNRLHGEINIESILDLDVQIREHETAIAELKRSRNSLLNIYKLPPEVLGKIFHQNVTLKGDFDGLEKESHNFLLVCHHWFEVALSTPELWSFWGNTPKDWVRWCRRSGTAPLDLVLDVEKNDGSFGVTLCNVLRDRATRDSIRRVHLRARSTELLNSIISPLTAEPEELRSTSVESFILRDKEGVAGPDISRFLANHHFPKLQRLGLFNCRFSSWDLIMSRSPILTTLDLYIRCYFPSPTPTASKLLSALASYPTLQRVSLSWFEHHGDGDGGSDGSDGSGNPSPRASLPHLEELTLGTSPGQAFGILDRLDHPRHMDHLDLTFDECTVEDISHLIGPYLRDYLRHRGGSQSGLGLSLTLLYDDSIVVHVGDAGGIDFSSPVPARVDAFMAITMHLSQERPPSDLLESAILDLIAHTPREEIVYFRTYDEPVAMEKISTQLPYLKGLHFERTHLPAAFPKSNLDREGEIFPSLQYILLDSVFVDDGDWSPLKTFLDRRMSSGNQLHTLVLVGTYRIAPSVRWSLGDVVREFKY